MSSATSSALTSPYLTSMNAPGNHDVPALVPSALGHRTHHSISSSSNSSTGWSAVTDHDDEFLADPYVYPASEHLSVDMLSEGSKSPGYLQPGLTYARRPSTTNNRSTVPLLNCHLPVASSSMTSLGATKSLLPSPFHNAVVTEDDSSSLCLSDEAYGDHDNRSTYTGNAQRRKRNRVSLPAYFSLLQGQGSPSSSGRPGSPPSPRPWRTPSALQSISRSLHASPTTPRVSHATATAALSHNLESSIVTVTGSSGISNTSPTTTAVTAAGTEGTPRGRGRPRVRDAETRSSSSRRSHARSPLRQSTLSAVQRARIDSIEKVAEWVMFSPVVAHPVASLGQQQQQHGRRNSSPNRKVKYEFVEALTRGLRGCAIAGSDDEEDEEQGEKEMKENMQEKRIVMEREHDMGRGRRRVNELDEPLREDAPGLGSGRSGLRHREKTKSRETRERGRAAVPIRAVRI